MSQPASTPERRSAADPHEEEELGRAYDGKLLLRLWPFVRPYRRQVWATLLLFFPIFVLELAPAWVVKVGLDHVLPAATGAGATASARTGAALPADSLSGGAFADALGGLETWLAAPPAGMPAALWLAGVYFAVSIALSLLAWLHQVVMATTGQHAMFDLRRTVFARIQKLHMSFFDTMPVGRLVTRATNDVENLAEMFSQGLVALVTDVIKMLGFAVVLFLVSPRLTLFTFAIVPVMAIAAFVFRWKVREAYRAVRVKIARINTQIQETVTGMKVVQLFGREARNLADFDAMNADHRNAWYQSIRYDSLLFSTIEVAIGITMAVIIGMGTGLAEAGILYVFIDYMQRFFMPLRDLSAKYSVMQSAMSSTERIFQLLDTEPGVREPATPAPSTDPAVRGSVEFDHVWFRYDRSEGRSDDWILRDVSFRVAPGEKIAFVGATGAGKTTIIKLLTRLYDVERGSVRIDGVDVRSFPQVELRRRIATVLQDVFLFSGTLARNIALGRGDLDAAKVERSARAVEAHAFIERLPAGYATEVHERGSNFSTGQRQILSFARALAHGAPVLVLDEATSAIDPETEAAIQRGIRVLMEGKTAIAIAHRLSTIRDVDRIYVLAGGEIVESGSHEDLLALDGVYARLYRLQAEREEAVPPALVPRVAAAAVAGAVPT